VGKTKISRHPIVPKHNDVEHVVYGEAFTTEPVEPRKVKFNLPKPPEKRKNASKSTTQENMQGENEVSAKPNIQQKVEHHRAKDKRQNRTLEIGL
jgi:hypothetical protein